MTQLHVMSGPHQGQTWDGTPGTDIEFRYPHPDRPGVLCRYRINDSDGPVNGLPEAVQLHYIGDTETGA